MRKSGESYSTTRRIDYISPTLNLYSTQFYSVISTMPIPTMGHGFQEDTISINHNWFNAYNISWVVRLSYMNAVQLKIFL